eukprot:3211523-Amphidinium_carterae.1
MPGRKLREFLMQHGCGLSIRLRVIRMFQDHVDACCAVVCLTRASHLVKAEYPPAQNSTPRQSDKE